MGDNLSYNLCDYVNKLIENLTTNEQVARDSLSLIDTSINKRLILRQEFDISEEGKRLTSLK